MINFIFFVRLGKKYDKYMIIDTQPLQLSQRLLESTQGIGAVRVVTTNNKGASESPACSHACHCQAMNMK